jgi:Regulator of chromosome condensation (RCC1) repeat
MILSPFSLPGRCRFRYRAHLSHRSVTTAVFAIGEGWTGALGTGRLDQTIAGHDDANSDVADRPVLMYESDQHRVLSCSVGWGHTAFVVEEIPPLHAENVALPSSTIMNADNTAETMKNSSEAVANSDCPPRKTKLLVTGRPHDFSALLRLNRLPRVLRQYAVHQTYRSVKSPVGADQEQSHSLHPVDLVDRIVTYLSGMAKPNPDQDWEAARKHSFLVVPTVIDVPESPVQVVSSAGITAVVAESGALYTFGLNGMGQCGVGHTSNNVWIPSAVTGLSREFATGRRVDLPQSYPIHQAGLGLQRKPA